MARLCRAMKCLGSKEIFGQGPLTFYDRVRIQKLLNDVDVHGKSCVRSSHGADDGGEGSFISSGILNFRMAVDNGPGKKERYDWRICRGFFSPERSP